VNIFDLEKHLRMQEIIFKTTAQVYVSAIASMTAPGKSLKLTGWKKFPRYGLC
jgi:hypothetical protein